MALSEARLSAKGWTKQEIAHAQKIFSKPTTPVHLLWLPAALLAQTLVMLRLLPLLIYTQHTAVMIATVVLAFGLSWVFMEIAPTLAKGVQGGIFILIMEKLFPTSWKAFPYLCKCAYHLGVKIGGMWN